LQKASGKSPLSIFEIALWTSSFDEETPLCMYLEPDFITIFTEAKVGKKLNLSKKGASAGLIYPLLSTFNRCIQTH
jgi:hypothetical protein